METLAEQPTQEKLRSFDPMASVHMLRYDLQAFGRVLPETRERVCNEELSYLVEGMDRVACTSFVIKRDEREDLIYFNRGQWRPYTGTLLTGLETARKEAAADPRRQFLLDRATDDLAHGFELQALQPGEHKVWFSPYAHREEATYGEEFIEDCGLIPKRKMGFIYRAEGLDDGTIHLQSHTVDNSDEEAFAAVMTVYAETPTADIDSLVGVYDQVLSAKHGQEFKAGRAEEERQADAWTEINQQRDLIEFHLERLEELAAVENVDERTVKRHLYGVWATFKKRLDGESTPHTIDTSPGAALDPLQQSVLYNHLAAETQSNFKDFASKGMVLVGCGGAVRMQGEDAIMAASASDVFSSIFGGEDGKGSLTFTCKNGHRNRRPWGKLLSACQHGGCKARVKC